jgi:two-component system response regulator NreC
VPSSDMLTALVQRLVRLVGAPTAIALVDAIPDLAVDAEGRVLSYNHERLINTARALIDLCEAVSDKAPAQADGATPAQQQAVPGPQQPARLLIVDDHALVREGLANLLDSQPDLAVVGQAGSMREAITAARELQPDLILMDFTLPDGTGDEAARLILAALPETRIIFLTVHDDDERVFAAISSGAVGYLLKSVRSADLVSRVREVARGEVALSPTVGRRIFEQLSRQHAAASAPAPAPPPSAELTERENEILGLIVQGYTNRQIATRLSLSVRTVEYHRANMMDKLGLHSRAELVRYAAERGLTGQGGQARGDP